MVLVTLLFVPVDVFTRGFNRFSSDAVVRLVPRCATTRARVRRLRARCRGSLGHVRSRLRGGSRRCSGRGTGLLSGMERHHRTRLRSLCAHVRRGCRSGRGSLRSISRRGVRTVSRGVLKIVGRVNSRNNCICVVSVSTNIPCVDAALDASIAATVGRGLNLGWETSVERE